MNQLDAGETSRTLWSFCLYNSLMDLLLMRQSLRPGLKLLRWSLLISATFFSSFFITDGTKWCVLVVNCFTCWCKWLRLMQTFFLVIALVRYDSWEKLCRMKQSSDREKGQLQRITAGSNTSFLPPQKSAYGSVGSYVFQALR